MTARSGGGICSFLPRDAMLNAVYAVIVYLFVCLCLYVTLWYCIKTAKRRITQTKPHNTPRDPSFLLPTIYEAKFERDHPLRGATNAGGVG